MVNTAGVVLSGVHFLPLQEVTEFFSLEDATELLSSYLHRPAFIITGSEKYGFSLQVKQLRSGGSGELCCPHHPRAVPSTLSCTTDVLRTVESSDDGH